ncbi:C5a anaphylatoxin chemotactic receptor 1-like [Strongylocentrotus purpuratus]|uniref:G-protein coupled receptors family 1 profile domain-containing protein n=1 Tax=Strongylocentrotus purpuratus TaxID=7668 RepID=A0A7M7N2W4_STRPU|nr:C5a anaphylatoxin chemotactic receptor 1-like [Strongylocentrotus purpuratus]
MAIMTNRSSDTDLFVFEDYNQRIAIAIILCIIFIVGAIGNTLVITAVGLSRKLRSSTNWLVVNLGCSDLLTCLSLPFNVVALLSRDGWPLPGWICAANSAVILVCLGASVMTLALIAYNRCSFGSGTSLCWVGPTGILLRVQGMLAGYVTSHFRLV